MIKDGVFVSGDSVRSAVGESNLQVDEACSCFLLVWLGLVL